LLVALAGAVILALAGEGGATTPGALSYSLIGTATMTPAGSCVECPFTFSSAAGDTSCSVCLPSAPSATTFNLNLPSITTYPSDRCRIKNLAGRLTVTWPDGEIFTAAVSGHFIDAKSDLVLSGTFDDSGVSVSNFTTWSLAQAGIEIPKYPNSACSASTTQARGILSVKP
jgi:hypothetical protein